MIAPMMATPAIEATAAPALPPVLNPDLGRAEESKDPIEDTVLDGPVAVLDETPPVEAVEDGKLVGFREVESVSPHLPNPS